MSSTTGSMAASARDVTTLLTLVGPELRVQLPVLLAEQPAAPEQHGLGLTERGGSNPMLRTRTCRPPPQPASRRPATP